MNSWRCSTQKLDRADRSFQDGIANLHTGRLDEAERELQRAARLYHELGERGREASALGNVSASFGRFAEAISYHTQHMDIATIRGDKRSALIALGNLGLAHLSAGDCGRAGAMGEQALQLSQEIGDQEGGAGAYVLLCAVHFHDGRFEEAVSGERAVVLARRFGAVYPEMTALGNLVNIYHAPRGSTVKPSIGTSGVCR